MIVVITSIIIIFSNLNVINNQGFPNRYDNLKLVNKNYNVDNFALAEKSIPKKIEKKEFEPSK